MSDLTILDGLKALHQELVAVADHRFDGVPALEMGLGVHAKSFRKLIDKNPRKLESRKAVESGKITVDDIEFSINKDFQQITLQLADELDLDEKEAAQLLLDSEDDLATLGRPLLECGLIRFHQQRKYLLDCMRLCIQLSDDADLEGDLQTGIADYVAENIYCLAPPGQAAPPREKRIAFRCLSAMQITRSWLQKLSDRATAASVLNEMQPPAAREMFDFSRVSLVQQHESLAMILCGAVEKSHASVQDFEDLLKLLQKVDRYDALLVHIFPVISICIRTFGSVEGQGDYVQARKLHQVISKREDDGVWQLVALRAAVCTWWISEYIGWYVDERVEIPIENVDVVQENKDLEEVLSECLKEGALDFLLAVSTDVEAKDWHDPTASGVQMWIQRKCPLLPADSVPFSDFFRVRVLEQLELFIDAFITNLHDVIRQLRVDEDEQRQLSQAHEQSLELERFLLIISHAYEGRPDAAEAFWSDPESNLAGFMQWASHRASTPLVSAFCEMLRSISGNEVCAVAAHTFLLDDLNSTSNTGRMRKSQSLSWTQVVKELEFFTGRIRALTNPTPALTYRPAPARPADDQEEAEPESAVMLECYLRLIARICTNSKEARGWLMQNKDFSLVGLLFQLASLPVPGPLRACIFTALTAMLTEKTLNVSYIMWNCLEEYMAGIYVEHSQPLPVSLATPTHFMEGFLAELSQGFEQPYAFIQCLLALSIPADDQSTLNDALPFPESLGAANRMSGIDPYVDFVLDVVLGRNVKEWKNKPQQQALRLGCLDFAVTCLATFNEDLIAIANDTALPVDAVMATTDLATYVRLHPFARVMEWMYNHNVVEAIFGTIHENSAEIGSAPPDSPLILGIVRAVELINKILDLQDTYLDLVRQVIRAEVGDRRKAVSTTYGFFEEAISLHLDLVVDLGICCSLGYPSLTLACLKLLEKISTSPRVMSAWTPGPGRHAHRNKAIVALEKDGEAQAIAGTFISELVTPLDVGLEAEAPNYSIKTFILDFLYSCLQALPNQPTIAHMLLGFRCNIDTLSVEAGGSFDNRTSLFHNLLRVLLETPFGDETGMRQWLILLKHKIMRIFQALWRSPLSSAIVLADLRENNFAFHLLIREATTSADMPWDGMPASHPDFPFSPASIGYIDFWALRAMTLEYICIELCSVSQSRMPSLKRRIFDALNGQISDDNGESIGTLTVFDLYEFLSNSSSGSGGGTGSGAQWDTPPPPFQHLGDVDLRVAATEGAQGEVLYDLDKARQVILLKAAEVLKGSGSDLVSAAAGAKSFDDLRDDVEREEIVMLEYLSFLNRQKQFVSNRQAVLQSWVKLLLVVFETNDFSGAARVALLLQALQAILPGFEAATLDDPAQAFELAKLAEVLLFKLNAARTPGASGGDKSGSGSTDAVAATNGNGNSNGEDTKPDREILEMSSLVSDKLFQLFQICLFAICKWAGGPELRAVYYNICFRYVVSVMDEAEQNAASATEGKESFALPGGPKALSRNGNGNSSNSGRLKAHKAVALCGERVLNVICDDAYGSDAACQTAALILLGALVRLGEQEQDTHVVDVLQRLNFIGVLVDSLKTVLKEGLDIIGADSAGGSGSGGTGGGGGDSRSRRMTLDAKLALLLQLCQTRSGATYTLHANLFRSVELSGLFSADPELQVDARQPAALAQHYGLLVKVARVISAAVVSRGSHNILQGRRFLADHRMLVMHVLKRSAGIGTLSRGLDEVAQELAETFMVLIVATDFLEFEDAAPVQPPKDATRVLFH